MASRNSKVHISLSFSRESYAWIRAEAINQQTSRSQIVDNLVKSYRGDVFLLEKIEEMIGRVSGR